MVPYLFIYFQFGFMKESGSLMLSERFRFYFYSSLSYKWKSRLPYFGPRVIFHAYMKMKHIITLVVSTV